MIVTRYFTCMKLNKPKEYGCAKILEVTKGIFSHISLINPSACTFEFDRG